MPHSYMEAALGLSCANSAAVLLPSHCSAWRLTRVYYVHYVCIMFK